MTSNLKKESKNIQPIIMRNEMKSLTGLRFIALFLVLFAHSLETARSDFGLPLLERINVQLAYLGMSLFFVLSGFVLAITYRKQFSGGSFLSSCRFF